MDLMLIFIIAGVSILVSFCCSILEAGLFSITRSRIETLRRQGDPRGETLAKLRQHIDESIAAILIVNTIAHTIGAAWAGALVRELYDSFALGVFSAVFTFAILFFSEIIPKSLGVRYAAFLAPLFALPLQIMTWSLWPLVKICVLATRFWGKGHGASDSSEEDIISLASLVHRQGEIAEREAQWVANALRLNNVTAYDLMTPNPVVSRVGAAMTLKEAKIDHEHWRFSRIPVCEPGKPDRIVGVVQRRHVFDALARDEFDKNMQDLMAPPEFVPETLPAHQLLDRFLEKRRHLFCVLDETEIFTGVVTLEDVLECLLGQEIVDETDLHEDMQAVAKERKEALLKKQK